MFRIEDSRLFNALTEIKNCQGRKWEIRYVTTGVPQGPVLGPTLYITFVYLMKKKLLK